ncbi:hypothetical protein [Streptomyces sp. NPDC046909]|uniref:hypothetical protein n=1 Tax=Streptomyces sp. NPDC046909 TaxID=3155617 RepID=UPI0033D9AB02
MSRLSVRVALRSQRFLEPGEQIRGVVLAQGGMNPWLLTVCFMAGFLGVRFAVLVAGAPGGAADVAWGALGAVVGTALANAFFTRRVLLATDRGLVVLEYPRFGSIRPTRVRARLPLGTGIGPLSGIWARTEVAGERLWVHKKWHKHAAAFVPVRIA